MTERSGLRAAVPTLLAAVVLLAGCTSPGADPEPSPSGSSGSSSPTEGASDPATEELAFGDHRMAQPCSLMPPEAVERIVGKLDAETTWRQTYLDRTLTQDEVVKATDTLTRAVHTSCVYNLAGSTTVKLEVESYRSVKDANARFEHDRYLLSPQYDRRMARLAANPDTAWIAEFAKDANDLGGEPVPGQPKMLYVPGFARFERVHENLVLTFTYQEAITFDPEPLTDQQYRQQLPWATKLLNGAAKAASTASTQPSPTVPADAPAAGPEAPFVEPCEVMDTEVFEALIGTPDNEEIESTSLPVDPVAELKTTFSKTVIQECSRHSYSRKDGEGGFADLEIRTTTSPDVGIRTLDRVLAVTYYDKPKWKQVTAGRMQAVGILRTITTETGADVAYLFSHLGEGEPEKDRVELLYMVVGPYVVEVRATHGPSEYVDEAVYSEVAPMIVENLRAASAAAQPSA